CANLWKCSPITPSTLQAFITYYWWSQFEHLL
ncbi:hypothetical protein AVEN_55563-1, partial [Araneus ventricosus]